MTRSRRLSADSGNATRHLLKIALAVLLALHGLIHLIGPAKAFGWWDVTQLRQPITSAGGILWLVAALLLIGAAIALAMGTRWWRYFALPGVILSQFLIAQTWGDAKFGTLANIVVVVPVLLAALDARPGSFQSRFAHDRAALFAFTAAATLTFNAVGELVGFVSNDRWLPDGTAATDVPWSTPISEYADVNGIRIGTRGDANWIAANGEWTYGRFIIREIAYNVTK
jgi:hypothetical protein